MIPLAKDTRESIGAFADKVENRALLFEKMVLAKSWGHDARFNDANRFNVLRACTGGSSILGEDRDAAQRQANSPRAHESNKRAARYKAKVAGSLAGSVKKQNDHLLQTRTRHNNQFLSLLEQSYSGRIETLVGTLRSKLLINMAGGVMENAGLALDRCFGLPYIPGSAVKGVARNVALWEIKHTEDNDEKEKLLRSALLVFGFIGKDLGRKGDFTWAAGETMVNAVKDTLPKASEFKGLCSFLPAYPCSDENLKIVAECMTPHPSVSDSAQGSGNPHPLFYPAVDSGSSFAFAIIGQRTLPAKYLDEAGHRDVLTVATRWIRLAITEAGLGAKTGAGYGWFDNDPQAEEQRKLLAQQQREQEIEQKKKEAEATAATEAEIQRRANLSDEEKVGEDIVQLSQQQIADFAKNLESKSEAEQIALCKILSTSEKQQWKKWKKAKKWKDRIEPIKAIAAQHDITLN